MHTLFFSLCVLFKIRLMNDFQKEVTNFWIRHPEKWVVFILFLDCVPNHHGLSRCYFSNLMYKKRTLSTFLMIHFKRVWNPTYTCHIIYVIICRIMEQTVNLFCVFVSLPCLQIHGRSYRKHLFPAVLPSRTWLTRNWESPGTSSLTGFTGCKSHLV